MNPCPCGSRINYLACCGLYITQLAIPQTPEALMRSRYTAYFLANIDYIKKTMQGKALEDFNEDHAANFANLVQWIGLNILNIQKDSTDENIGFVEFIATYMDKGIIKKIHEQSEFKRINGHWFYIDGKTDKIRQQSPTRNAPCPCGSQKKFKNCHARK